MLKVFLVEDETVIREGLRDRIPWEQYGYRFVGEAADGEVALPLIRKTRPDVLITDIKMPFMDGLSLSRIVREEFPKTKILIISGYDDFEYAREAISIGVDQYILKPVTRMSLRKVLQELKEKIEAEQEQEDFQSKLANEMHEYEQFSIRHFFEQVLEGELCVTEIYDEAAKWSLDLSASCYNLLFLYVQQEKREWFRAGDEYFCAPAGRNSAVFSAFSAIYPVSLERQLLWGFSQMRCGGNGRLYTAGDCTDPDELRVTKRQCRLVCCCGNACGTAVDAERVL